MAIVWGGWSGRLRVGIEVVNDGYDTYTPSINVYVRTFVQCDNNYNFSDSQALDLSGSIGAHYDFFNNLGSGEVRQIGEAVIYGQGQSYNGGPGYYFEARLSGAFNGATPSVGVNYTLPARPPRAPAPPSYGPQWSSVTPVSGWAGWGGTPDYGGSGLIEDNLQVSRNPEFTSLVHDSYQGGTSRQVNGLSPGTRYWSRSRVRNGVGWSGWSAVGVVDTSSYTAAAPVVREVNPDSAVVSWVAPGGATPTGYELQVATNPQMTAGLITISSPNSWATQTRVPNLAPGTVYYTRVRVNTSTGWGGRSSTTPFETLSGAKVRIGGAWKDAPVYVRQGGQWKVAKVYKRVGGQWVL